MLRFLADENFNGKILRGLLRRNPGLDIVRAQDVGLAGSHDRVVLEWAADEHRILLTHDVATVTAYAFERMQAGAKMPGICEVGQRLPIAFAIEDILLLAEAGQPADIENQIIYLPL